MSKKKLWQSISIVVATLILSFSAQSEEIYTQNFDEFDDGDLAELGIEGGTQEQVLRLAKLATGAGLKGLVCSPQEIEMLRAELGDNVQLVTPGIRPAGAAPAPPRPPGCPGRAAVSRPRAAVRASPAPAGDAPVR